MISSQTALQMAKQDWGVTSQKTNISQHCLNGKSKNHLYWDCNNAPIADMELSYFNLIDLV